MPDVRARVAFYASTPGYRAAFDAHGLTDLAIELAPLRAVVHVGRSAALTTAPFRR